MIPLVDKRFVRIDLFRTIRRATADAPDGEKDRHLTPFTILVNWRYLGISLACPSQKCHYLAKSLHRINGRRIVTFCPSKRVILLSRIYQGVSKVSGQSSSFSRSRSYSAIRAASTPDPSALEGEDFFNYASGRGIYND